MVREVLGRYDGVGGGKRSKVEKGAKGGLGGSSRLFEVYRQSTAIGTSGAEGP